MLFIDTSIQKTPTEMKLLLYTYSVMQINLQSILINTGWYRGTGYFASSCFIKGIFTVYKKYKYILQAAVSSKVILQAAVSSKEHPLYIRNTNTKEYLLYIRNTRI